MIRNESRCNEMTGIRINGEKGRGEGVYFLRNENENEESNGVTNEDYSLKRKRFLTIDVGLFLSFFMPKHDL